MGPAVGTPNVGPAVETPNVILVQKKRDTKATKAPVCRLRCLDGDDALRLTLQSLKASEADWDPTSWFLLDHAKVCKWFV